MNKLDQICQAGIPYNEANKAAFKNESMRLLRAIVKAAGLAKGSYDLRYNAGGIAVSGEATLHTDNRYIQVSESAFGPAEASVLVRTCEGQKDYSGGQNHFVKAERLYDAEQFAEDCIFGSLHGLASSPSQLRHQSGGMGRLSFGP